MAVGGSVKQVILSNFKKKRAYKKMDIPSIVDETAKVKGVNGQKNPAAQIFPWIIDGWFLIAFIFIQISSSH